MEQIVRTDDGRRWCGRHAHVLICDRDRKWSGEVRRRLEHAGIRVLLTLSAPECERLRGTFRSVDQGMSLDWLIPPGVLPARRGGYVATITENGTTRASTIASSRARR